MTIPMFWHNHRGRKTQVKVKFIECKDTRDENKGNRIVTKARQQKLDVICGPCNHSLLVAGQVDANFFVWDPNPSDECGDGKWKIKTILEGKVTLQRMFRKYSSNIEFWTYKTTFKDRD
jgi:hypothetical protein